MPSKKKLERKVKGLERAEPGDGFFTVVENLQDHVAAVEGKGVEDIEEESIFKLLRRLRDGMEEEG